MVGNTSTGIYKNQDATELINVGSIPELLIASYAPGQGVTFGAAVTLTNVINLLTQYASPTPNYQTQKFLTMVDHLKKVANFPVRNVSFVFRFFLFTTYNLSFEIEWMYCWKLDDST